MIWSKQFFYYDVRVDQRRPEMPATAGKNASTAATHDWQHLNNADIISMPDKWEYPWYRRVGSGVPLHPARAGGCRVCQGQLVLLTREWYMHPNGQLPAYEWAFGDVNPPVHAWATWRVFQMDRKQRRQSDPGQRRPRVSRTRVSQTDAQLHLVGESQGRAGPQHFSGRLPRPGQHRRVRSQRAVAHRRFHQSSRRHELDGDVFA
jgi:hypothetical protein